MTSLYDYIQTRPRPEDVAKLILNVLPLDDYEQAVLNKAIPTRSRYNYWWGESSMSSDWHRPVSAARQVQTLATLFKVDGLDSESAANSILVTNFADSISQVLLHRAPGDQGKMTKKERHAVGIFKTQRWYNKRLRAIKHLEDKIKRLAFETRKYSFTRIGKSALALQLSQQDLEADVNTACLVAYMVARMSRRSAFTNKSQDRAFDEVASMLLHRCEQSPTTRWDVIAHVMPDASILSKVSDKVKGELIGKWWTIMVDMADMLQYLHLKSPFNFSTMIVARRGSGQDSTTWNQVAGGWNQARAHWVSLLYATGTESILDTICPGKVLRLIAGDVARWHEHDETGLHDDTLVWFNLPKPWEVVTGNAHCTRTVVEQMCERYKVKPNDWTGAKGNRKAVETLPTPELVHGVAVSSPVLAAILRKAGAFSGKSWAYKVEDIPGDVYVDRAEGGFVTGVSEGVSAARP